MPLWRSQAKPGLETSSSPMRHPSMSAHADQYFAYPPACALNSRLASQSFLNLGSALNTVINHPPPPFPAYRCISIHKALWSTFSSLHSPSPMPSFAIWWWSFHIRPTLGAGKTQCRAGEPLLHPPITISVSPPATEAVFSPHNGCPFSHPANLSLSHSAPHHPHLLRVQATTAFIRRSH